MTEQDEVAAARRASGSGSSDLATCLLEAIQQVEKNAEEAKLMRWVFNTNRMNGRTVMEAYFRLHSPDAVICRCKADRATVTQYELLRSRPNYVPGLGETLTVLRTVVERLAVAYLADLKER